MPNYNLQLGYNWNAAVVGKAASEDKGLPESPYRPLQIGLADGNDSAAFYNVFQNGDKIRFQIYDLDTSNDAIPTSFILGLTDPATGQPVTGVLDPPPPSHENPCTRFTPTSENQSSSAFGFSIQTFQQYALVEELAGTEFEFTFDVEGPRAVELSVGLEVQKLGEKPRVFLVDPEMWIGEDPGLEL